MVEKAAAKPAAPVAKAGATGKPSRKPQRRNYNLGSGVYRFGRSRMFHKKALWKFIELGYNYLLGCGSLHRYGWDMSAYSGWPLSELVAN